MEWRDAAWLEADACAWEVAAQELDAQGYERKADAWYPAVFVKDGAAALVLTRKLGRLVWTPQEVSA